MNGSDPVQFGVNAKIGEFIGFDRNSRPTEIVSSHFAKSAGGGYLCIALRQQVVEFVFRQLAVMGLTRKIVYSTIRPPFGSTKRNTVRIRGGPAAVSGDESCKVEKPATDGAYPGGKAQ